MSELMSMWNNMPARHAMLVHLPVVLGLLGFAPVIGWAATRFKARPLGLLCLAWFLGASLAGLAAANAGHEAEEHLEGLRPALSQSEQQALERHEELGQGGWLWPLIPAALVAVVLSPVKKVRVAAGVTAIVTAVGVAVWVAVTAHAGGKLVYDYGLGPPERGQTPISTPASGQEHEEDD